MTHPAIGDWTNALGGAAVVGLGMFVLSVRPRTVANLSFVIFAVGFGTHFLTGNAASALHSTSPSVLVLAEFLAWGIGAVLMALTFPRRVAAAERGPLIVAAAGMLALTLSGLQGLVGIGVLGIDPVGDAALASAVLAEAALGGYLVLLALRFRRSPDAEFRRQAVLTAAALTMYVGFIAGFGRGGGDGLLVASGSVFAHAVVRIALVLGIAATWLASTSGPDGRTARNMAWLSLAMPLLGLLARAGEIEGGHGIARVAMATILAYAILRHQLLGIDVKVRWGITKSTVAAVFIAVFFVASEAAQQFFGETTESAYLGIAAAGALVFALAPLQRAAERLAERAVPVGPAPALPAAAPGRQAEETTYRVTVRKFLADGAISREEERHLARVATRLGLDAERATEIRHEVEEAHRTEVS